MTTQEQLEQALDRQRNNDIEGAEAMYREMLDETPSNAEVMHLLALLRQQAGDIDGARDWVEKALAQSEDSATFHSTHGSILHVQGDVDGARAAFERALELNPNLEHTQNALGYLYLLAGEMDKAEHALKMALKLDSDFVEAMTNMGHVMLEQGKFGEATRYFQQALELAPEQPVIHTCLGRCFLEQDAPGLAEQCFRNALKFAPDMAEAKLALGEALVASGLADEADELARDVLASTPENVDATRLLGDVAAVRKSWNEAIAAYMEALKLAPGDAQSLEHLARAYVASGQIEQAAQTYVARIQQGTAPIEIVLEFAQVQADAGHVGSAINTTQAALQALPGHAPTIAAMARYKAVLEGVDAALAVIEEQSSDKDAALGLLKARLLANKGDTAAALDQLERLGRLNPEPDLADEIEQARADIVALTDDGSAALPIWHRFRLSMDKEANRFPTVTATEAASWPTEPVADDRPEPVFLTAFPGAPIAEFARGLTVNPGLAVLLDRLTAPGQRNDILTPGAAPGSLNELDEGRLRLLRRRYDHAKRRWTPMAEEPRATIDVLPWTPMSWYTIYRAFPQARVLVLARDLRDHLLHALRHGFPGVPFGADAARVTDAVDQAWGEFLVVRDALPLAVEVLDESAIDNVLASDSPLPASLGWDGDLHLQPDWRRGPSAADQLPHYLPAGTWSHFTEPLAQEFARLTQRAQG